MTLAGTKNVNSSKGIAIYIILLKSNIREPSISIVFKLELYKNAFLPIEVTDSGITNEIKFLHIKKAPSGIEVIELGSTTEVTLLSAKAYSSTDVIWSGSSNDDRLLQRPKARLPIVLTDVGNSTVALEVG